MYRLTCDITISTQSGRIRFDKVTAVSISRSIDKLTDTAVVTLPRRIKWKNVESNPIHRGDPISISLGYDGDNHIAFVGYVAKVGSQSPMTIQCSDPMMNLRVRNAKKAAYKSTDIKTMLTDQGLNPVVLGTQKIGSYRVCCNSIAELLDSLKKYNIRTFYRLGSKSEPVLYSGLAIRPDDIRTFHFDDHANIASAASLDYSATGDVRFLVKVTSHQEVKEAGKNKPKNKKVEVKYGDNDGEIRSFNVIGMSEAQMKTYAQQQYEKLKQGGLQGSFTVFGGELIDKYDYVSVTIEGRQTGTYQVDKNEITYGDGGFRQKITVGTRVSD